MNRLLVILDLDETLVHVPDYPLARRPDFEVVGFGGYRRPFLDEFLDQLRGRYDVAVWTAAGRDYAHAVVSTIIPWWTELAFLWSAEDCTRHFDHETGSHTTIKQMREVRAQGYELERVLMVDDSPEKHLRDYGNLIPIQPFLGDPSDAELLAVGAFIHTLAEEPNVRSVEKRLWRMSHP